MLVLSVDTISYAEMGVALNAWCYAVTVKQLHTMLSQADKNNLGQISEPEFKKIILYILRNKIARQGTVDRSETNYSKSISATDSPPAKSPEVKFGIEGSLDDRSDFPRQSSAVDLLVGDNEHGVEYVTTNTCSHAAMVKFANDLVGANRAVYEAVDNLREVMAKGPNC
jgi:hypothetical protein